MRRRALMSTSSPSKNIFPMTLDVGITEENKAKIALLCEELINHIEEYDLGSRKMYSAYWELEPGSLTIDGEEMGLIESFEYRDTPPTVAVLLGGIMANTNPRNPIRWYELIANTGEVYLEED